jgi:hypothetical protein
MYEPEVSGLNNFITSVGISAVVSFGVFGNVIHVPYSYSKSQVGLTPSYNADAYAYIKNLTE